MTQEEPFSAEPVVDDDVRPAVSWAEASRRLGKADTFWLATVNANGRPHLMPVLGVWADGALHFAAGGKTVKRKNLARDPHCAITTGDGVLDLVVEGEATAIRDEARLQRVAEAYASKYDWHVDVRDGAFFADGAWTAGPPPFDVFEVKPSRVYALGIDESFNATRFRF